jgi:hypothetical protein
VALIELAQRKSDLKSFFHLTRKLAGKNFRQQGVGVRLKSGKYARTEREKLERWLEHFRELFNRPPPLNPISIERSLLPSSEETVNMGPITLDEVRQAIAGMRSGKAPGVDGITAELLKSGGERLVECIRDICQRVFNGEEPPLDWRSGILAVLPKKNADQTDCTNSRGITLLSVPGKVFTRVLLGRILRILDSRLRENQS